MINKSFSGDQLCSRSEVNEEIRLQSDKQENSLHIKGHQTVKWHNISEQCDQMQLPLQHVLSLLTSKHEIRPAFSRNYHGIFVCLQADEMPLLKDNLEQKNTLADQFATCTRTKELSPEH